MRLRYGAYGPLYLPVETVVRELDAKLLLSAAAVARGYCVVIGRKSCVRRIAKENGRGFFSINQTMTRMLSLISGHFGKQG